MNGAEVWIVILALGAGTYLIRFSFLGLIGSRRLPEFVLRLLRYTPVALFPGIIAPLVLSPAATDGQFDPARGLAALFTLGVALVTRNMLAAIAAGAASLYTFLWLLG
ncbi:Branched-chain amino acid transport protein [Palleronia salina]|uniref:Branched-chain amino acid transport protein n=1 Tax=Palleronia salina TaxID=313368 RepID=A0A1M6KAM3_9RHOB|nr:AzlD domain-containing protein [Palleronia salina]SHJ55992.1 Branched-chain amino acid transport protein [Palleronia salina]